MMNDYTQTVTMTLDEFIAHERHVWGDDYVFDLLDKGYTVHNTDRGWRWFAPNVVTRHVSHITV